MQHAMAVILLTLTLGLLPVAARSGDSAPFAGTVHFAGDGAPAAQARILLFDLADLHVCAQGFTDAAGRFALEVEGLSGAEGAVPQSFTLGQNYPNPFNPGTLIPYAPSEMGHVRLEVYNLVGQRVAVLVDEQQSAGDHAVAWDARDGSGQGVSAGVYLYRLTVGDRGATRRMVLLDGAPSARAMASPGAVVSAAARPVAGGAAQEERLYGLTISGAGLETYVDPEFSIGGVPGGHTLMVRRGAPGRRGKARVIGRLLGDVTNDGRVNISDALVVATYGIDPTITAPNGGDMSLGDVNADGRINITDALMIATYGIDPSNVALPAGIGEPVAANTPPVADAGADQTVELGVTVTLDGSGSYDADGDALSYTWTEVGHNPIREVLSDSMVVMPTFTPSVAGIFSYWLHVHDGAVESEWDMASPITSLARVSSGPNSALHFCAVTLSESWDGLLSAVAQPGSGAA